MSGMSRKQFVSIANIFQEYNPTGEWLDSTYYGDKKAGALMSELIAYFKTQNDMFDEVKFAQACIPKNLLLRG